MMKILPVLYVEDEEDDVIFMRRAFRANGIVNPLHVTRDGEETLGYLKKIAESGEPPCLVLLDLNLPLFSGFEVLDWMRKTELFQNTPVCVLSSSDAPKDIDRAKTQGANEYRVKPSSPAQLIALVEWIKTKWLLGPTGFGKPSIAPPFVQKPSA
jgi:CheY-like chemotaxis protein